MSHPSREFRLPESLQPHKRPWAAWIIGIAVVAIGIGHLLLTGRI